MNFLRRINSDQSSRCFGAGIYSISMDSVTCISFCWSDRVCRFSKAMPNQFSYSSLDIIMLSKNTKLVMFRRSLVYANEYMFNNIYPYAMFDLSQ